MQKRGESVASLLASLRSRRATLPPEIGSFAVLEVVETLRKTRLAVVDAASVWISDEGQVSVSAPTTLDERAAVRSACALLSAILSAAGRPPSAQLQRLAGGASGDGVMTLAALRDDLEASLVPLNRQASRRVLARMVREMAWESAPLDAASDAGPSLNDLDGELHRLLDHVETPSTFGAVAHESADPEAHLRSTAWGSTQASSALDPAELASLDALLGPADAYDPPPTPRPVRLGPVTSRPMMTPPPTTLPVTTRLEHDAPRSEPAEIGELSAAVKPVERAQEPARMAMPLGGGVPQARRDAALPRTFTTEPPPASGGRGVWVGFGLLGLTLLLVGTAFWLRPDLRARLDGSVPGPAVPAPSLAPTPAVARAGDLVVRVAVARAQVLRFVGRGPSVLHHVDVSVAHELVATNDGFAPARVVVPKDAEWELSDGTLRYEIALQLAPLAPGASAPETESSMPRDVGAASGKRGDLRVVTTPKGAKIYELVGFAPEARIADVAVDQVHEFLIVRPGYAPQVRLVSPSDFVARDGRQVADVQVDLAPLAR